MQAKNGNSFAVIGYWRVDFRSRRWRRMGFGGDLGNQDSDLD